jgi:hypothetical protein
MSQTNENRRRAGILHIAARFSAILFSINQSVSVFRFQKQDTDNLVGLLADPVSVCAGSEISGLFSRVHSIRLSTGTVKPK